MFGRNATAGAISIVTRDPKGELGLRQDISVGNYQQFRTRTTVDLPSWGPLSAYVTFVHDERRGDIRNLGANTVWDRTGPATNTGVRTSPKYLGDKNVESWFAAVKFEPSDSFKAVYKFDRSVNHFSEGGNVPVGFNASPVTNPLIGPLISALVASSPNQLVFAPDARRPDAVNNDFSTPGIQRNTGHSLTIDMRLSDALSLKNIASYRRTYVDSSSQLDGLGGLVLTPQALGPYATFVAFSSIPGLATQSPAVIEAAISGVAGQLAPALGSHFALLTTNAQAFSEQWSDELQLNFNSKLVTLTAGALWFHGKDRAGGPPGVQNTFAFTPLPASGRIPLGNEGTSYNKATSIAAYAQAEVHVLSTLDLVGGIRVTRDRKSGTFVSGGTYVPPAGVAITDPRYYTEGSFTGQATPSFVYKKTRPSYSVGLNFKPNDNTLLYAKYSDSFVSGGAISNISYAPEVAKSFEAGAKLDLFDRRLRTNLALFTVKYEHLQSAQGGTTVGRPELGTVIIEQGDVRAKGFEFELTALPVDGVTLNGSLGYTDVENKEVNPILLASQLVPTIGGSYQPTLSPKWTSNLGAQYDTGPLFGDASLRLRVDGNWRSKMRFLANPALTTFGAPFTTIEFAPSRWIVNARAALREIDMNGAKAEFSVWAKNLNNSRAPNYAMAVFPIFASLNFEPARTYGVDLSITF